MYPFTQWTPADLIQRLTALRNAGFGQEAVVGAAQVVEQALKRVLRSQMVERRSVVGRSNNKPLERLPARSREDVDRSIQKYAQSVVAMKEVWRVLSKDDTWDSLPKLVDDLGGNGTWCHLVNTTPQKLPLVTGDVPVPYGLLELRHLLVHGTHSPPRSAIEAWAAYGIVLAESLLKPEAWTSRGFSDPFQRARPFRKRASDKKSESLAE